jgi:hypothetical protein
MPYNVVNHQQCNPMRFPTASTYDTAKTVLESYLDIKHYILFISPLIGIPETLQS